ncbi:type II toxin-antitoxin system VapC family toxin [Paraburkholderia bengalensis]|uniref:Type II toxin-antitoxin system VapC family toxin n=1 Tax=Paraburkholderia bengalensis TaxID=2747562 RepID=A0ABU8J6F0_9BURK
MKIAVDTNVLLRAIVADDDEQADKATALLDTADMVAVSLQTLCELVWVLRSAYKVAKPDIASAIRALLDTRNVVANRPAAEAGLALLEAGGILPMASSPGTADFLGGEQFISFDKKAVSLLTKQGHSATLL